LQTLLLLATLCAGYVAIQESSPTPILAQSAEQYSEVNIKPEAYLSMVNGSIHVGHPAKAQIVVTNSVANKSHLTGEIMVVVPNYITITHATSGPSGGSNFIQITLSPIAPGSAYPVDIFMNATSTAIGEVPIIKARVDMRFVGNESSEVPYSLDLVTYVHIKPGTQRDCEGNKTRFCEEEDFYDARFSEPLCTNLRCEPWGEYLLAYAAIAGALMGVVTIRSVICPLQS